MRIVWVGFATLVLGLAVAHGADVVPPSPSSDPAATAPDTASQDKTAIRQDDQTLRTTGPDGSVRDERRVEQKSKTKKKIDEKTTY